jgi:hypothetical protein
VSQAPELRVEFCGEWHVLDPEFPFVIGRDADLVVDDNPYLHRRFLEVRFQDGIWWLVNLGGQLSATTSDGDGRFQGWLAPGAHLPIVFEVMKVRFTAGSTAYELSLHLAESPFSGNVTELAGSGDTTTLGRVVLTPDQRLLVVALAEAALQADAGGRVTVPSSAEAAARLGWPMTKFNRKLDNVCQKLKKAGVRGLHGGPDRLASDRRSRLVEYALSVRLVTAADLALLDAQHSEEPAGEA